MRPRNSKCSGAVFEIDLKQLDGEKKIQQAKKQDGDSLLFYHRLTSGRSIVEIFRETFGYNFSNEDPRNEDDVEFISMHIQNIHEWSEIWTDIEPGSQIKAIYELGEMLKEMEARGMGYGLGQSSDFRSATALSQRFQARYAMFMSLTPIVSALSCSIPARSLPRG